MGTYTDKSWSEAKQDLDISDLRRLCDEAWPPPWEKFGNTVTLKLKGGIVHTLTLPGDHQTLAFIAQSRTVVPSLMDEIESLRAELERVYPLLHHWAHEARCFERERDELHAALLAMLEPAGDTPQEVREQALTAVRKWGK